MSLAMVSPRPGEGGKSNVDPALAIIQGGPMSRGFYLSSSCACAFALTGVLGLGLGGGCDAPPDDALSAQREAVLAACHLDDGTIEHDADLHACDPQDAKKTTICHIPPGNPANAHTICVGNPAVPHHIQHHGDYVGICKHEVTCPPPGMGSGGASGTGGSGDDKGTGGSAPGTGGTISGSGGTPGTGGSIVIP
jgi:hypothetical protein